MDHKLSFLMDHKFFSWNHFFLKVIPTQLSSDVTFSNEEVLSNYQTLL